MSKILYVLDQNASEYGLFISKLVVHSNIFCKHNIIIKFLSIFGSFANLMDDIVTMENNKIILLFFNDMADKILNLSSINALKILYVDTFRDSIQFTDYNIILTPHKHMFNANFGNINVIQFNYIIDEIQQLPNSISKEFNKIYYIGEVIDHGNDYNLYFESGTWNNGINLFSKWKGSMLIDTNPCLTYRHIEILLSGSLAFFVENEALSSIGLKKYIHYIPVIIVDNKIQNYSEIVSYIDDDFSEMSSSQKNNTKQSRIITCNAQQFVLETFPSTNCVYDLINIICPDSYVYKQSNIYTALNLLRTGKSFIRYGDGDFILLSGKGVLTQASAPESLISSLKHIMVNRDPNVLIGLPPFFLEYTDYHFETDRKKENVNYTNFFKNNKQHILSHLHKDVTYYDSNIFRPYLQPKYVDVVNNTLLDVVKGKNICMICNANTNLGVAKIKKFCENVKSVKFIHVSSKDAYTNDYIRVKHELSQIIDELDLILVCAGPIRCIIEGIKDKQVIDLGCYFRIF